MLPCHRRMIMSQPHPTELNLAVDENNLPEEWKRQAAMMLEYGILLADAMAAEDTAKAALAVKEAELATDIRANPDDYDVGRVTDASVAAAIPVQPDHQVAVKKLNSARHDRRVYQAAVDALDHRKRTLQGMTDLFMRQWYADPKGAASPPELREAAATPPRTTKAVQMGRRRRRRGEE